MAIQSAVGYSEDIDESYEAGLEIGDQVLSKLDLKANSTGILFCYIDFDFAELLRGINEKLDIPIIGCTTATEANNQGYFEESASLMVITADDVEFGLGIGKDLSKNSENAVDEAFTSASGMLEDNNPKLALTFPDAFQNLSAERILRLLEKKIGKDVPVVGGLPGDNFQMEQTYQFYNQSVYSDSIPLLLMSGNIEPLVITRSGWIPVGKKLTATKVEGNVLYEINHQPALEYFKNYVSDIEDYGITLPTSAALAILDESLGDEAGQYFVIRAPFSYNEEDGSVIYNGDIPQNALMQFARGSREDILAGANEAIATINQKSMERELSTLLCFSCGGRKLLLGLDTKKEVEVILKEVSSQCAVNGFFTYGEIGPIDNSLEKLNKNRFHNATLVLCAF